MLTRQERQEVVERAKAYKKEEELSWDQFSYVLLGIQSWRSDDELLDRIVELCNVSNVDELAFRPSTDELYLQALKAKHVRMLERKGFQHPGLWTFEQASHMMSRLAMNRWIVPRDINPATYDPNN